MKLRTVLTVLIAVALLPLGALATIHDLGLFSEHPLARLSIVLGKSMTPTLKQGEGLVFVRAQWRPGDIVLAETDDGDQLVKRVVGVDAKGVHLAGDNRDLSAICAPVPPDHVLGKLIFHGGRFNRAITAQLQQRVEMGV